MAYEWICPQCSFRTSLPLALCPHCHGALVVPQRPWASSRRAPRIRIAPAARCEVNWMFEAAMLEVSRLGACLEHRETLRPGQRYLLSLPLARDAAPRRLSAQVVWTSVHRFKSGSDDKGLIFRSGVEFRDLPAEVEQDLGVYVTSLGGTRPHPAPAAAASPPD